MRSAPLLTRLVTIRSLPLVLCLGACSTVGSVEGSGAAVDGFVIFCASGPGALALVNAQGTGCDADEQSGPRTCESLAPLTQDAACERAAFVNEGYDTLWAFWSDVEAGAGFFDIGEADEAGSAKCGEEPVRGGTAEVQSESAGEVVVRWDTDLLGGTLRLTVCE